MAANTLDLIRARERKLRGGTPAKRPESLPAQAGSAPTTTGQTAYDNFYKNAQDAGLLGSFSEQDLQLAQKNPAAGMSILSAKQQWQKAQTDEERMLANKRAEAIRSSYGGYTGGTSGGDYNLNPLSPISFEAQDPYGERIDRLLTALENREPFQFSYNPNEDPEYQAFRKAALREGQRATQETMGDAAMMTGGRPSSYAVTAAGQQGNYFAGQIADRIPALAQQAYQRAYQKYTDEFTQKLQAAGMLQGQQQANYGRLLDEVQNQRSLREEDRANRAEARTIASEEWQKQLTNAQLAAQYGDYSQLEAMGFDVGRANFDRDLAIAQMIASYTGDTSALMNLFRQNGYTVPEPQAVSYGGGNYVRYIGDSGPVDVTEPVRRPTAADASRMIEYQNANRGYPATTDYSKSGAKPKDSTRRQQGLNPEVAAIAALYGARR